MDLNKQSIMELISQTVSDGTKTPGGYWTTYEELAQTAADGSLRCVKDDLTFLLAHIVNNLVSEQDVGVALDGLEDAIYALSGVRQAFKKKFTTTDFDELDAPPVFEKDRIELARGWEGHQTAEGFWEFFPSDDWNKGYIVTIRLTQAQAEELAVAFDWAWKEAYNKGEHRGACDTREKVRDTFELVLSPLVNAINGVANKTGGI